MAAGALEVVCAVVAILAKFLSVTSDAEIRYYSQ
jgi:hypothetical protein